MELGVMTFNLYNSPPEDKENRWEERRDSAAEAVRKVSPAVVGTQEGTYPMLHTLNRALPGYDWIGLGRDGGVEGEFTAIFYDTAAVQLVAAGHFWLSHEPEQPGSHLPDVLPRMCTWARLRTRGRADEALIYNTHLDHQSQEARELGARLIRDHILGQLQREHLPVIVLGDMNAGPSSQTLELLRRTPQGEAVLQDGWDWARAQGNYAGATHHGFGSTYSEEPIDYILYTRDWELRACQAVRDTFDERYPSDHYPVWAVLRTG